MDDPLNHNSSSEVEILSLRKMHEDSAVLEIRSTQTPLLLSGNITPPCIGHQQSPVAEELNLLSVEIFSNFTREESVFASSLKGSFLRTFFILNFVEVNASTHYSQEISGGQ